MGCLKLNNDYYPSDNYHDGMQIQERSYSATTKGYRFGFQGQEGIVKPRDVSGNLLPSTQWVYDYYVRDASGNIMANYKKTGSQVLWTTSAIYGSSRVGMYNAEKEIVTSAGIPVPHSTSYEVRYYRGKRSYELSNHQNNVLAVVTGRKIGAQNGGPSGLYTHYEVVYTSITDYYPFGSKMESRSWSASGFGYRHGFNGMEQDNEVKGDGNSLDFGARIYDSRLGRWLSLDPLQKQYPSESHYGYVSNNPIVLRDVEGKSGKITIKEASEEGARPQLVVTTNITLYGNATEAQATLFSNELNEVYNGKHTVMNPFTGDALTYESDGKKIPITSNDYKIVSVDGVEYDLVFDFNVSVNNDLTKKDVHSNTDVANNFVRVGSDKAKASKFNAMGNTGMVRAGDLTRKSKSGSHEILHGYTGKNHPDSKEPIVGQPSLNVPEGSPNVESKYKHSSCKYGGLCGQNRVFSQENADNLVKQIKFNEDKTEGKIGNTQNHYYNEMGDRDD